MSYPSPFTFVGVSNAAEVASGNLTLVTTGVTIQTGDLVVACIAARGNAAFSAPDASWAIVEQQTSGNTATDSTSIASGVMMVCESWPAVAPSLVFTRTGGDVGRGVLMVYRGQKAAASLDSHSSATLAANSVTAATASITTAEDSELLVAMVAGANEGAVSAFRAATDPTTQSGATDVVSSGLEGIWYERHDSQTLTGADATLSVGDAVKSAAGATGELRATHNASLRHVMIVAAFKNSATDRSAEQVSKASRYDVMQANDAAISATKLSRYDIFMAVGKVSVTKFSRYDILVPGADDGPKRRVQNINYF